MFSELIKTHWPTSLKLFQPANLKLFALGTMATVKNAAPIFMRYFWWAIVLQIVVTISIPTHTKLLAMLVSALCMLCNTIILYGMIMSTRPSLEIKNCAYFRKYSSWIWGAILLPIAFPLLFFLDGPNTVTGFLVALKRTLRTIIYNFPVMLVLAVIAWLFGALFMPTWSCFTLEPSNTQTPLMQIYTNITSVTNWRTSFDTFFALLITPGMIALSYLFIYFGIMCQLACCAVFTVWYVRIKHNHFSLIFGK